MTTTLDSLREMLVRDHDLEPDRLTAEAPLESLGVDSLGMIELFWNAEEAFGIDLPTDPPELATLGEVADYLDGIIERQRDGTPADAATGTRASVR